MMYAFPVKGKAFLFLRPMETLETDKKGNDEYINEAKTKIERSAGQNGTSNK